jgi:nitrogen fixation protein FixH
MSLRINSVNQNYNVLDYKELSADLRLAELEEMSTSEYDISKYAATGQRPVKIAKADAEKFGLRKAFWDIYAPIENPSQGQWIVSKDAESGDEFITRKIES